jgi:hypothetical protein
MGWLNEICDTVTFHLDPPIYHINHVRHRFDFTDPKVAINQQLRKANKNYCGSNYDTKWHVVEGNKVVRRGGSETYILG